MRAVRGMRDLFGEDMEKYNLIIEMARKFSQLYNFMELQTPILEFSDVFERNLGETSDVVMKEIYKFQDKSDNYLSLRPEFTAGVARAISTNPELRENLPLKLFSYGPVFRYDRPQMGRYRQFSQINFEYFGNSGYLADVEILQLSRDLLQSFGLVNLQLEINSLGSDESKKSYEAALIEYFKKYYNDLSEYSKVRLEKNALRILDSKEECDQKLLPNVPKIKDFYTLDDKEFFANILNKLSLLNIKYSLNPNLARGLDYYTSTVFEFTTADLGAQSTVLGGGRYDHLMENMGGSNTPSVGFAAGVDRLMLLINKKIKNPRPTALINIAEKEIDYCLTLQNMLKNNGINIEFIFNGKIKQKLGIANKLNCRYAVIIGENEVLSKELTVKNLDLGEEQKIKEADIMVFLKKVVDEV